MTFKFNENPIVIVKEWLKEAQELEAKKTPNN